MTPWPFIRLVGTLEAKKTQQRAIRDSFTRISTAAANAENPESGEELSLTETVQASHLT